MFVSQFKMPSLGCALTSPYRIHDPRLAEYDPHRSLQHTIAELS